MTNQTAKSIEQAYNDGLDKAITLVQERRVDFALLSTREDLSKAERRNAFASMLLLDDISSAIRVQRLTVNERSGV